MSIGHVWISLVLIASGCGDGGNVTRCITGQADPCACGNGSAGVQTCNDSGQFGPCDCTSGGTNGGGTNGGGTNGTSSGGTNGTSSGGTNGTSSGGTGGPRFLSFGSNVTSLTVGQSVTFSAVLTDSGGIDALAGGTLQNADGSIQYGAFAIGAQKGAYSITISWDQINQVSPIDFDQSETITFVGNFFDSQGLSASRSSVITLSCNGVGACDGKCVDLNSDPDHCGSCGVSCASRSCTAGGCDAVPSRKTTTMSQTCSMVCGSLQCVTCPEGYVGLASFEDGRKMMYDSCSNLPNFEPAIELVSYTCCCR